MSSHDLVQNELRQMREAQGAIQRQLEDLRCLVEESRALLERRKASDQKER